MATCGLTEEEAVAKLGDVDVFQTTFKPMKHTLAGRPEKILMKLLARAPLPPPPFPRRAGSRQRASF